MAVAEVQMSGGAAVAEATVAEAIAAVELAGCGRSYGERPALQDLSLSLPAGQTLVVFGPNGAGKTTLLRVLATLLRPHAGLVRVLGCALPGEAWRVRGRIGLLGHEPLLYRELTPRENLLYHARLHGLGGTRGEGRVRAGGRVRVGRVRGEQVRGKERLRVEERLLAVGMLDRADEPLRTLSRGMVQRVALARATLHDPELLLLDEPYANLDPAAIDLVAPLIGANRPGANIEAGATGRPIRPRTRVLSSHDPTRGLAEADLVLGLRAGRPALLGPASEIDPREIAELYR